MKRTQVRALTLAILLTLTLCLLPAAAGAVSLSRDQLDLKLGEKIGWGKITVEKADGEILDDSTGITVEPQQNLEDYGMWWDLDWQQSFRSFWIYGTPSKLGEIEVKVKYSIWVSGIGYQPDERTLWIYITDPNAPVPPVPTPVDRPEIPDYSRCEQALIRGVKEWCNIRQRADINSDIIGRATLGQRISLICWNEDETWCYVDCGGEQGWIAKQFILPIK